MDYYKPARRPSTGLGLFGIPVRKLAKNWILGREFRGRGWSLAYPRWRNPLSPKALHWIFGHCAHRDLERSRCAESSVDDRACRHCIVESIVLNHTCDKYNDYPFRTRSEWGCQKKTKHVEPGQQQSNENRRPVRTACPNMRQMRLVKNKGS